MAAALSLSEGATKRSMSRSKMAMCMIPPLPAGGGAAGAAGVAAACLACAASSGAREDEASEPPVGCGGCPEASPSRRGKASSPTWLGLGLLTRVT